ncbi:extracellular solute-binding protein [Mahella australiensis]|uniref:Extracellular solute-binding protein family 1 n=1 Tax=Mahella australiensis (strain DSM 15567 / CIP 107919 / 50-1 BON) TaxID=697281 RepID=F3ZVR5_MAHA5|nr:extracellular solute-binding protein [Mahella australiensis]AEE97459.1 extracellular solute-binding protein family 1 [Mahella australiensis 50-1 BON]
MKRLFIVTLVFVLAISVFLVGCDTGGDSGDKSSTDVEKTTAEGQVAPAGQFPIVKEPIELTFYKEGALSESDISKLDQNGVLKYIADKTNIKLKFIFLNPQEGKQKMILSFASGDYPDGALLDWSTLLTQADIMQYGMQEKILTPLNDLIDTYGAEIKKIFALRPNYRAYITAPDGEIYGIPRFTECGHCMSYPKLWMNYAWLDKLGLNEPQTTEELYNVLKAFRTQDPNGNGEADEVALTGCIDYSCAAEYWLMNSFIDCPAASNASNPRPFLAWIDGKVTFIANRPEYKQGLEFIKKLYDEKLIDPANFTQNSEGLMQQCRKGGDIATVGAYTCDHMTMGVDYNGNKDLAMQYHALPPVAGPNGVRYQSYQDAIAQFNGFHFAIFDTCKNKEAAFRLADYFLSEEFLPIGHYGIEGINWERPKDPNAKNVLGGPLKWVPITLPQDAPQEEKDKQTVNTFWIPLLGDLYERRAMWAPEATPEALRNNYETYLEYETLKTKKYWPDVCLPRMLFMDKQTAEEFSELKTNITNHVIKNTSMFITGARPLGEWDDYVNELKRFGVDRYVEIYSKAYADYQSKMK